MIDPPHRVLKIGELTRLIANQLILINRGGAVDLACTSRYLEEPVLSTLWEIQDSLCTLLKMLPRDTWDWDAQEPTDSVFTIVGDPSPEAWGRVHRYASWMYQASVDVWSILGEETYRKLRLNAPVGGWFPALEDLSWRCIWVFNLPYLDLFLSPNLKRVTISMFWDDPDIPRSSLPVIASTISSLPAPTLRRLSVHIDYRGILQAYLKDSLSFVVSPFGPFTEFSSSTLLSDIAVNHLVHLPHLRTWHTEHPPPDYSTSSLPLVFPPLREFTLGKGAARGWLSLFKRLGDCVSSTQGTTPLSRVMESLESLNIGDFPDPIIGASFVSTIQTFQNLVHLNVMTNCRDGQCIFKLDNNNVAKLASHHRNTQKTTIVIGCCHRLQYEHWD